MRSLRIVAAAWAAFVGGAAFGYGYMSFVPTLSTDLYEIVASWGAVAVGAVLGVALQQGLVAVLKARTADSPAQSPRTTQDEVLVRG